MKIVPVAGLVSIASYIAAQQVVSPQRRAVKLGVFLLLLVTMMRFDMVWSIYLFTVLFPFPSGISIGSTNSVLMTVIPLVWAIRASSTNTRFFLRKTRLDFVIILFLFVHVISLFNLSSGSDLGGNLEAIWLTAAAVMYFYMIVMFVNDEKKLLTLMKISCIICALVMLTGLLELYFPGATIIPGWIGMKKQLGAGSLSYRIEGMRPGGVFNSQVTLADFGARTYLMMLYLVFREKNYFQRSFWVGILLLTTAALVATANRGGVMGLALGLGYGYWLFRDRISVYRLLAIVTCLILLFAAAELVLSQYTYATSLSDRLLGSRFEGSLPDTRKVTWEQVWRRAIERPWFGHGPKYEMGVGLEKYNWPHNGYLFYFHALGIVGLIAFLIVLGKIWIESRQFTLFRPGETELADIQRLLHIMLVVFMFQQMRTDHQVGEVNMYLAWGMFGLIVTTAIMLREIYAEKQRLQSPGKHKTTESPDD